MTTRRKERRKPFKIGGYAVVPSVSENISTLKSSGTIITIQGQYARVRIVYGKQTGFWDGLISDLDRRSRHKNRKERRKA